MVDADDSTELWRPQLFALLYIMFFATMVMCYWFLWLQQYNPTQFAIAVKPKCR